MKLPKIPKMSKKELEVLARSVRINKYPFETKKNLKRRINLKIKGSNIGTVEHVKNQLQEIIENRFFHKLNNLFSGKGWF